MLAYAFYDNDNRIIRYAETLLREGYEVDAVGLRRPGQPEFEVVNGVNVHRIQERERNEKGKFSYLYRILKFLILSSLFMIKRSSRYELIHIHSVPDFEVFAAWLPKLRGARLILDVHDIVPEFYVNKFNASPNGLIFKLLLLAEKLSCAFADHVIIANDIWKERIISRSVKPEKCTAFANYPDPARFSLKSRTRDDDRFIILYPGGLQKHQGLHVAVKALPSVLLQHPKTELHIYGEGAEKENLVQLCRKHNLEKNVIFHEPVPFSEIPSLMRNADLGVVPKLADSFGNEAYSTKILEFISQELPVLVSKTKVDTFYFNSDVVYFFESGNHSALAKGMTTLISDRSKREELVENGRRFIQRNNWGVKQHEYVGLVENLVQAKSPAAEIAADVTAN